MNKIFGIVFLSSVCLCSIAMEYTKDKKKLVKDFADMLVQGVNDIENSRRQLQENGGAFALVRRERFKRSRTVRPPRAARE